MALSDLNPIEQQIIGKLFDQLDAADKESLLLVDLDSGGDEPDVSGAWVRSLYEAEIGASDETVLKIMNRKGVKVSIMLIHGNEIDVIADYGWSKEHDSERWLRDLLAPVEQLVEMLEMGSLDEIAFAVRVSEIEIPLPLADPDFDDSDTLNEEYLKDLGLKMLDLIRDARKIVEANK